MLGGFCQSFIESSNRISTNWQIVLDSCTINVKYLMYVVSDTVTVLYIV